MRPAVASLMALLVSKLARDATAGGLKTPAARGGLMHLMEQRDIILNGTQALGPIAVGLTHEAAEQILRVVRVGISAKATWGMVAMRALQRARQVVSCLVVAPTCGRVVDLHGALN